jgi:hypothetical protein
MYRAYTSRLAVYHMDKISETIYVMVTKGIETISRKKKLLVKNDRYFNQFSGKIENLLWVHV